MTTTRVVCAKTTLQISADVSKSGAIKVTLLDKDNEPLAEGELVTTTVTDAPVQWKDGFSLQDLQDQPIKLRFELREAKLFSFSFEK